MFGFDAGSSRRKCLSAGGIITAYCFIALLGSGTAQAARSNKCWSLSISGAPPTSVVEGQTYSFIPSVSGRHNALQYGIANKPSWASFDSSTGTLSGVPSTAQVGQFSNIVINVTNGCATASLAPFSIDVTAPASPPTISGTPSGVATVGTAYFFQPTAADPDGDALSFSVQNKPAWASFSIATGSLTGTPTTTDVGTYSNIVVSVSDGTSSTSLAPFSISVSSPTSTSSGSVTLSWTAPTTNTDGTQLTNLSGYTLHYGTTSLDYTGTIQIPDPSATSYILSANNFPAGTYYFAISAYNSQQVSSALSAEIEVTIN